MPGRDKKKPKKRAGAPGRPRREAPKEPRPETPERPGSEAVERGEAQVPEKSEIASVGDEPGGRPRTGQLASEAARFDLGPHGKVIGDALGLPPPGYGTTMVSLFVRDPSHVVAVWDVNDEASLARADERGWGALELRIVTLDGGVLAKVQVGERSGVYHVALESNGVTVSAEIGFSSGTGDALPIARSVPVRVPALPGDAPGSPIRVAVPPRFDRRALLRAEAPPRVGHRPLPPRVAPAARLVERIRLARRVPLQTSPVSDATPGGADRAPGPGAGSRSRRGGDEPSGSDAPDASRSTPDATRPLREARPPRAAGEPVRSVALPGTRGSGRRGPGGDPPRRTPRSEPARGRRSQPPPGTSGEGRGGGHGPSGEGPSS